MNPEWLLVHHGAPEQKHGKWHYTNAGILLLLLLLVVVLLLLILGSDPFLVMVKMPCLEM